MQSNPEAGLVEFTYNRTPHDIAADQIFNKMSAPGEDSPTAIPCVIMAFVNRSGSNHVADVLKTTGYFAGFEEMLNGSVMKTLAPKYGVSSLPDYVSRVVSEQVTRPGQMWGVKAAGPQLAMLLRCQAIPNLLRPSIIRVKRRDIIGQAISLFIAEQTQRWTSLDKSTTAEVIYNAQRIIDHVKSICNSYSVIDQVLAVAGFPVYDIVYEDFLDHPNKAVSDIGMNLFGQSIVPNLEKLTLSRQQGEMNTLFRIRFMKDAPEIQWIVQ